MSRKRKREELRASGTLLKRNKQEELISLDTNVILHTKEISCSTINQLLEKYKQKLIILEESLTFFPDVLAIEVLEYYKEPMPKPLQSKGGYWEELGNTRRTAWKQFYYREDTYVSFRTFFLDLEMHFADDEGYYMYTNKPYKVFVQPNVVGFYRREGIVLFDVVDCFLSTGDMSKLLTTKYGVFRTMKEVYAKICQH